MCGPQPACHDAGYESFLITNNLNVYQIRLGTKVELNWDELSSWQDQRLSQLSSTGCIWIDWDILSVWSRRKEWLKIDSGSNVNLFMSRTKCIIFIIPKIGTFQPLSQFVTEHTQLLDPQWLLFGQIHTHATQTTMKTLACRILLLQNIIVSTARCQSVTSVLFSRTMKKLLAGQQARALATAKHASKSLVGNKNPQLLKNPDITPNPRKVCCSIITFLYVLFALQLWSFDSSGYIYCEFFFELVACFCCCSQKLSWM